ncbi:CCA tRNA nucleotidyltransferase [uncultured Lactobacillus sp.]|uniref:CCA tRNA nucleotidyltransferase n=1 Tax=uncultured Lactobacillus sp. TaxID=153152 RepID=UPI002665338E|nr:CCA tRNA nucleotidyltransferase [uncultured Lactobacillus sp.]
MKINQLPELFVKALPVLQTLEQAGFEAYFVGGCVRDLLLGRHIHDVDITTNAYPEEVKKCFDRTIDTGIQHGTVTALYGGESYEITTYRTESGYQDFRRPDKVTFVQNLDEDLKRRDFTINALAMNTKGEIVDLFHGLDDLDKKVIRAVGVAEERFHEDALRMMRAVRFMSQLRFSLEGRTRQAIVDNHELLSKISIERVREEFVKMGTGPDARRAFAEFLDTGLSEECPHLAGKKDQLTVFTSLKASPSSERVLWSLIVILLNLPEKAIGGFMKDWKNSNAMTRKVKGIAAAFDKLGQSPSDVDLFEMGALNLNDAIDAAFILGQPVDSKTLLDRYQKLPIKDSDDLAIDGRWLIAQGVRPGPKMGTLLNDIKTKVINGDLVNSDLAIAKYVSQQL